MDAEALAALQDRAQAAEARLAALEGSYAAGKGVCLSG